MSEPEHSADPAETSVAGGLSPDDMTDGEINFLWSFIQGSIVIPETWNALLRGYGFCERHAWIHLNVEMAFRDDYLLGPTILYGELIAQSVRAVETRRRHSAVPHLRASGPCLLCAANVRNAPAGACPPARLARARDTSALRRFTLALQPFWQDLPCPCCASVAVSAGSCRCRQHLLAAAKAGAPIDFSAQLTMLHKLSERLSRYENSFLAGGLKAGDRDRAALLAAVGWCSGWRPLLAQIL